MSGAPQVPLLLTRSVRAVSPALSTYTTAKRVINDEDVITLSGNFLKAGAGFKVRAWGGLSNIVSSPGNVFFQVMMGSVVAWSSGNLAFNAAARVLLPFKLEVDLTVLTVGDGTEATFLGQGTFGGIHLTNTDQVINVPTTAPAAGTGFNSEDSAKIDLWAGFSVSNVGNAIQVQGYELWQVSGF